MSLEFSTVGAKVYVAEESTPGTRVTVTTGWTELTGVVEAPEINLSVDTLECSNITDSIKRYIAGQQDTGGEHNFTFNHTDAIVTAWEGLETDSTYTVEYVIPGATKSFFFSMQPRDMGTGAMSRNEVHQLTAPFVVYTVYGWETAISRS